MRRIAATRSASSSTWRATRRRFISPTATTNGPRSRASASRTRRSRRWARSRRMRCRSRRSGSRRPRRRRSWIGWAGGSERRTQCRSTHARSTRHPGERRDPVSFGARSKHSSSRRTPGPSVVRSTLEALVIPANAGTQCRPLLMTSWHSNNIRGQIVPVRVDLLDQLDLPASSPLLDLLLARDRRLGGVVALVPNELVQLVLARETADDALLVFVYTLRQARRYTRVQCPVPAVCQDVNAIVWVHELDWTRNRESAPSAKRTTAKTLGPGVRRDDACFER